MWYPDFSDRLDAWHGLRTAAQSQPLEQALDLINQWWFKSPWQAYYLHWDDQAKWPDPWQLLSDNVFCEVARGLGILYTISMIDHPEIASAELILTEDGYNLVQVNKEKYILNWEHNNIVNTRLVVNIKRQLKQEEIKQQYN
jgi:hypothetical protein